MPYRFNFLFFQIQASTMVFTADITPPPAGTTPEATATAAGTPRGPIDAATVDHRIITATPEAPINPVDMEALSFEHYPLTKNRSAPSQPLPSAGKTHHK